MAWCLLQLLLAMNAFVDRTSTYAMHVPLPPSVDAFYQPPANYSQQPLGKVLRTRAINSTGIINVTCRVYQLLYRSQNAQDVPTAGVTTVFVPLSGTNSTNSTSIDKVVALESAYDSIDTDCSPSYILTSNSNAFGEISLLSQYLGQGWAVSVADFEGFDAAFGNGIQAGYSTLDSVRAVLESGDAIGVSRHARVAFVGGSGGTIGSEFALELSARYATELQAQLVGALLMALVPDGNATIHANNGTIDAGLIPLVLQGLAKQYQDFSYWLSSVIIPDQASSFFDATSQCGPQFALSYAFRNTDSYLTPSDAIMDPLPQRVLQQTVKMAVHGCPRQPLFIYKGVEDKLSLVADSDLFVQECCSKGTNIVYQRATNADHGLASYGSIAGFQWLSDRLNGVSAAPGCTITNVTVPLDYVLSHPGQ